MNSQQLLWIIVSVGVFLFFLFFSLRWEKKKPTKLNLRAESSQPETLPTVSDGIKETLQAMPRLEPASSAKSESVSLNKPKRDYSKWLDPEHPAVPSAPAANSQRSLTVAFMYNGHDWEAFQVLGILPGTTLPLVTEAYQNLLKSSDVSSHAFFEAAYLAILHSYRDRRL